MKTFVISWIMILVSLIIPDFSCASDLLELDEHLLFLEPLISHQWEGGYVGENAPDFVMTLKFEPILSGKVVKYTKEISALGYLSETLFYWSPNRDEVLFIALNSRGIVAEGIVSVHDGDIVLNGENHWVDGTKEFTTIFHLDEKGILRDTFTLKQEGEEDQGHIQEFRAKIATD